MKNDPAVELCAGIERVKTPKLLLTIIVLLGLCGRLGIAAETNSILARFELILSIHRGQSAPGRFVTRLSSEFAT